MSGSISTSTGNFWSASGWVFRNILDRTAEVLNEQGHSTLARIVSDEESLIRVVEDLDLSNFSLDDRRFFIAALKLAHHRYQLEGADGWNRPDFYLGFMERFAELLKIVSTEGT